MAAVAAYRLEAAHGGLPNSRKFTDLAVKSSFKSGNPLPLPLSFGPVIFWHVVTAPIRPTSCHLNGSIRILQSLLFAYNGSIIYAIIFPRKFMDFH